MSLLYIDGFDMGDYALRYSNLNAPALSTSTRFSAGRCLAGTSVQSLFTRGFTAAARTFVGVAVNTTSGHDTNPLIALAGDAGVTQHIQVRVMTNGAISLYRGTGSGTLLVATAGSVFPFGAWVYLEVSATVNDTTGNVRVRLNGTEVVNFTGDTKNAGTNSTLDTVTVNALVSSSNFRVDDFYIADDTGSAPYNDFLGDVRVHTLSPTAAGTTTGMTPSTAPNWDCVNEQPYSATDYVSSSVAATKDTYAMADLPAGVGTVYGVQTGVIAKKSDAGARSIQTVLRSGGTDYPDAAPQGLAASDAHYRNLRTANPNGGAAWTVAAVNALEAGVLVS